jgi:hypothetical protein
MVRRVSNKQLMEKLEKLEKDFQSSTIMAIVFFLQSLAIACFGLASSMKDLTFFYVGFGVWVFTMVIFVGEYWNKKKK